MGPNGLGFQRVRCGGVQADILLDKLEKGRRNFFDHIHHRVENQSGMADSHDRTFAVFISSIEIETHRVRIARAGPRKLGKPILEKNF